MKTLSIDIETYSDQNLAKTGVYRYVESPVFQILLRVSKTFWTPSEMWDNLPNIIEPSTQTE